MYPAAPACYSVVGGQSAHHASERASTVSVSRTQLHVEVAEVVGLLETVAHGVVSANSPDADDAMKLVIIDAVFKLDAILALEQAIAAAFDNIDPTDF